MLLIYSKKSSVRLQYICKFIFEEILHTAYSITTHQDGFAAFDGIKINYSNNVFSGTEYHIIPHTLLFEENIQPQILDCFETEQGKAFFKTPGGSHPFDIFAATFFLLSRYEEYLPHNKDFYGRYAHENSLAHKEGFLNTPLINYWVKSFSEKLKIRHPEIIFKQSAFQFVPTYDIDIAWSYKAKGLLRNIGGFLKRPSASRIATLAANKKDPYDSYGLLDEIHKANNLSPIYFFLVARQNGQYDRNILPANKGLQNLIKQHADKYNIGLHPSWKSNDAMSILEDEKITLQNIAAQKIVRARQHYIKFNLPGGYQRLLKAGIFNDYSMGYGSINGFRASVASSFYWYDLSVEKITALRIHPFCFMDANCFYEQQLPAADSFNELVHYFRECKNVGGTFISIFHNNFLGTDKIFAGWPELYQKFISQVLLPE